MIKGILENSTFSRVFTDAIGSHEGLIRAESGRLEQSRSRCATEAERTVIKDSKSSQACRDHNPDNWTGKSLLLAIAG